MTNDPLTKLKERDRAMRQARDQILRRVDDWLRSQEFVRAGAGYFTRARGALVCHVGYQKKSDGRSVRVMCYITDSENSDVSVSGPWSDAYERPTSPNGKKYNFGFSTREADIKLCAEEYRRYLADVVFTWFNDQVKGTKA